MDQHKLQNRSGLKTIPCLHNLVISKKKIRMSFSVLKKGLTNWGISGLSKKITWEDK